ncbi:MAG: radical SAM protein [Gammaproteobacteria bacterium]|nr:radical SAM protein [Gammaproteobacteria bacterium]
MSSSSHLPESEADFLAEFTRKVTEARVPLDGSIELTHRCNLRCVHCYLGDQASIRQHRAEEMSTVEVRRLIDELVEAGTLNFTFTGGDPMVRKDFPELYTHAVRSGLLVTVFCDGVLVSDRIIELFGRYPPRKVEVSIYGATRETYESITQVPGSFERCLAGLDRLARNGHRFTLKTVLMTRNRHELDAMRAMAERYGVDFYFDTAIFPCLPHRDNGGHANAPRRQLSVEVAPPTRREPMGLRLDPQDAASATLADEARRKEMAALYVRTREAPASERLYTCGAAQTTFHVDPYGNLQPCTISTNVRYNVREGGFLAGWNGPMARIRELRARAESSCRSCDKQALCSGCPAFFFAETGAGDVKSDYVCRTTHAVFEGIRPLVDAMLETRS